MNVQQKRRLWFVMVLSVCTILSVFLMIQALRQNINFFYTPTQILKGESKGKFRIRVGGVVKKGSIQRGLGLNIIFMLTDFNHEIKVYYTGILPDLFKEGQGIIVLGTLQNQHEFLAEEVLAKHDENYSPPGIIQP